MALLEVSDLHVDSVPGRHRAGRPGMSFDVDAGQTLGIVGESGSGKSVSTQTIMGLAWRPGQRHRPVRGRRPLAMRSQELQQIRGAKVGMIFQDPLSSLHPFYKVGWQIVEMIGLHDHAMSKAQARAGAVDLHRLVGIPQPDRRVDELPARILQAVCRQRRDDRDVDGAESRFFMTRTSPPRRSTSPCKPRCCRSSRPPGQGGAASVVHHDLKTSRHLADEVMVVRGHRCLGARRPPGRGSSATTTRSPRACWSRLPGLRRGPGRLRPIPAAPSLVSLPLAAVPSPLPVRDGAADRGAVPDLTPWAVTPPTCPPAGFRMTWGARNALRKEVTGHAPAQAGAGTGARASRGPRGTGRNGREPGMSRIRTSGWRARGTTTFCSRGECRQVFSGGIRPAVPAAARERARRGEVSLEIRRGQTLGLVGETGCGKSTLASCIIRLYDLASGRVRFDGPDIRTLSRRKLRPYRREMQMIFQDPYRSLNPRRRVGSIIGDPF